MARQTAPGLGDGAGRLQLRAPMGVSWASAPLRVYPAELLEEEEEEGGGGERATGRRPSGPGGRTEGGEPREEDQVGGGGPSQAREGPPNPGPAPGCGFTFVSRRAAPPPSPALPGQLGHPRLGRVQAPMAFARGPWAPLLLGRLSGARTRAMAPPPPSCLALELPDSELVHFALTSAPDDDAPDAAAALLGPPGRSYSLCVPAAPGADCGARVLAARGHQRLLRQLRQGPLRPCQLRPLLHYCPGGGAAGLQHGVLLHDPRDRPDTRAALLALLDSCPEAGRARLGEFLGAPGQPLWLQLWERPAGAAGWAVSGRQRVRSIPEPALHPLVPALPSRAVFPHRQAARAVLQACTAFIPEAQAVLDLVDQCPDQVPKGKFPVIVIEGLDATGKTTVTQSVSEELQAVLLKSPPACISQWRQIFDDEPTIVKRAFYALGNYIVASEIARASAEAPVVVDRFWHSTAAYAIATEVTGGVQHLPPAQHPIYQWPQDLLQPDLVLLLVVSPEERTRRLEGRGLGRTREETELEHNSVFRQKVETCYRRMEHPACHPLDASPAPDEVLRAALGLIHSRCAL